MLDMDIHAAKLQTRISWCRAQGKKSAQHPRKWNSTIQFKISGWRCNQSMRAGTTIQVAILKINLSICLEEFKMPTKSIRTQLRNLSFLWEISKTNGKK